MTRRRHAPFALALLLGVGCHSTEGHGLPPGSGAGAPPAPAIPKLTEVAAAAPATAPEEDQAAWTGTLYARHEAQLGPKMTGILSQITVEEGDHVKKGQLLFRIDAAQPALAVEQAKAAIVTAQVGFDAAKLELTRATELSMKGSIAPASYDQAKSGFDRAASGLAQARVALQQAERGLADTTVYSPIDGVVTAKQKSLGETVTMMPPTVVLVVQDVERLELRARLPEKTLGTVDKGSALRLTFPTIRLTREVTVKRVNPTIDARTRTVEVVADVDNADGKLKVGMLAEVAVGGGPSGKGPTAASDEKIAGGTDTRTKAP